jgi:FHS family L-fucose permease-like MFS transporter
VLAVIWLLILFSRMSTPAEQSQEEEGEARSGALGRLWRNRNYRYGVAAQFFNVAAQFCAWTFTIQYAQDVVGVSTEDSGWCLQARPA